MDAAICFFRFSVVHLNKSTCYRGNLVLDLVITRNGSRFIRESPKVAYPGLCNDKNNVVKGHFTVHCSLNMDRSAKIKEEINLKLILTILRKTLKGHLFFSINR